MGEWLFDLGNTRLKYAPLDADGCVGGVCAVAHDGIAFADDAWDALPSHIRTAHVASVASPALRDALLQVLQARGAAVKLAATQVECDGLRIAYADPTRLGVDRFLALLGAHARGGAWLVAGVGTALTLDLLDDAGGHRGGRIAPSPALMRDALQMRARQLPAQGGDYREFAGDTLDALASGCTGAALGLIERSLREAVTLFGSTPGLLLHGGGAAALLPHLPAVVHAPSLVLEGLARQALARRL
ncbi:type III pantothenate kinase [Luteimonas aestuarii]|uniref:Type III pantothenate kinase n=1 Tax=Luteimonas aestuarii TaxID=453837 RepID=A0A4R5TPF8_9GAMM|nr:type III pantothenate kinase [Luteimonas aestuarii]TDK24344.1 type III pantothenate kinase [Luteimonas aestuarii]